MAERFQRYFGAYCEHSKRTENNINPLIENADMRMLAYAIGLLNLLLYSKFSEYTSYD